MKTPMQELIDEIKSARRMCDDPSMEMYIFHTLDVLTSKAEELLEKEKEVMQEFAWEYERECRINLERSIEKCWDKTFNTKEK